MTGAEMLGGALHIGATRAGLADAINRSPCHLKPVLAAVRDYGIGLLFVTHGSGPFRIPQAQRKPSLIMVGDDLDCSEGPAGFHLPSIRRAIRGCSTFAVITAAPSAAVYADVAASVAVGRADAMIIETRIEHEFQWVALIRKLAPRRPLTVLTVKGGNA